MVGLPRDRYPSRSRRAGRLRSAAGLHTPCRTVEALCFRPGERERPASDREESAGCPAGCAQHQPRDAQRGNRLVHGRAFPRR